MCHVKVFMTVSDVVVYIITYISFYKLWLLSRGFLEMLSTLKCMGGVYEYSDLRVRFTPLFKFHD